MRIAALTLAWILSANLLAEAVPHDHALQTQPMTIAVSQVGRFAQGHSWHLSINSAGQAELTIATVPEATRKQFFVAPEQLETLRRALIDEKFFELDPQYGQVVPDGSTTALAVTVGAETRAVKLHFLMNWVRSQPDKLREPARALRVLGIIRGWFEFDEAVDLRQYEQRVLDAAKP